MQRLEVRALGLVAGLDEGLVAVADQLDETAAQHDLLAEQIGLGLFLERRVEHARARAADALGVRERGLLGLARRVVVHRDEARHAAALVVGAAHEVTGTLRRDHPHVDTGGRAIWPKWMLKPCANASELPSTRFGAMSAS